MSVKESLYQHLKSSPAPLLFIGSGIARRYAKTADWEGLLRIFAEKADVDYSKQNARANGVKPKVASVIAQSFFDVWWEDPEYSQSVINNPEPDNEESPFKIEVANYFRDAEENITNERRETEEIEDLREASQRGVAAVVTTNFDTVTDSLFPGFTVFRSQEELLMSTPYGARELFKIHGCRTIPESMVLTQKDYDEFNLRTPYLSAKLLTLFVEHPVIFLGYSIDDPHIRQILLDVSRALSEANIAKLEGQLIFVRRIKEGKESQLVSSTFIIDDTPVPMIYADVTDEDYGQVFQALKQLRPKLPTKVVAQLKSEVYKILESENPKDEIYTRDIETLDDEGVADQVEVVVGLGIRDELGALGFSGVSREHLFNDVINPNPKLQGEKAAIEILGIIERTPKKTYIPVFKYLSQANLLDFDLNIVDNAELSSKIVDRVKDYRNRLTPYQASGSRPKTLAEQYGTFSNLLENVPQEDVLEALLCLKENAIDLTKLRSFLEEELTNQIGTLPTPLARAICLYDYISYGPGSISQ